MGIFLDFEGDFEIFFDFQYMIIDFSGFLEEWSRVFHNRLKNVGV